MGLVAILTIYVTFFLSSQGGSKLNLAFIGQGVLEKMIFENDGHIQVYSPGAGVDNPLGSIFLINTIIQSI